MGMIKTNDGRVIVAIPSMRKIGDSKWAVYFMEDNQIYTAIYYMEEKGSFPNKTIAPLSLIILFNCSHIGANGITLSHLQSVIP